MTVQEASRVRAARGVAGSRRAVAWVVVGVALLQALWIAVVPPFRGSDEFDHAYRAAAVADGQWRATEVPEDGRGLLVATEPSIVAAAHDQCTSLSYTKPDNCTEVRTTDDGHALVASGAANYNPIFYWVVGTVAQPFDGAAALYAMRLAGALLCLVLIGLGAWCLTRRRTSGWVVPALVVTLSPVLLFSTAIAAPNGLEMAAAVAFWCALLGLADALDEPPAEPGDRLVRRLLAVAAVAGCVLATTRLLGPMFVGTIALSVWLCAPELLRRLWDRARRPFLVAGALVAAAVAASAYWILSSGSVHPAAERQGGPFSWTDLVLWPLQSIAAFPYRDQPGALVVYPIVGLLFVALVVGALRAGRGRERVAVVVVMVASLAIPLAITAATYDGRGSMWQGRYGLPYAVGILLVAGHVLERHDWRSRWRAGGLVIGAVLMAIGTAACLVKVLDDELTRSQSAGDPAWHAPSTLLVWVVACVAWATLWWASSAAGRRAGPSVDA